MKQFSICALFTVCLLCRQASPALANEAAQPDAAQSDTLSPKQEARQLFAAAERHYAAGDYEQALALYEKAFEVMPLVGFHFNLGQCHRKLKQWAKASEHFRLYAEGTTDAKRRKLAEDLAAECESQLRQESVREATPRTPAKEPRRSSVEPVGGRDRSGLSPVYFWSGVGLTGALTIATAVTGVLALSKSDSFNDPNTPPDEREDLRSSGETLSTAANVSFGLALASAAATVALYFFTDFGGADVAVSAGPMVGGGAVSLGGRF